jgi:hypothetical protein
VEQTKPNPEQRQGKSKEQASSIGDRVILSG